MESQTTAREVVISHKKPTKQDHVLAFNLLRDAGYHVDCDVRRTQTTLIVTDPIYQLVQGFSPNYFFSHFETVFLNSWECDTLLQGAVRFIEDRS